MSKVERNCFTLGFDICGFTTLDICFMGKRREARERAVQFLFQHDLNPPDNLELELATFWNSQRAAAIEDEKGAAKWGEEIRTAAADRRGGRDCACSPNRSSAARWSTATRLTKKSKAHAKNWDFHRIAAVDRNIMRLAIYEMLHRAGHPAGRQHQRGGGHRQKIFHARTAANS